MVGLPDTPEEKAFLKSHKVERKAYFQKKAVDMKAQMKREKLESKMSESKMQEY